MDTVHPTSSRARVQLREPRSSDGFVDGAWWPGSHDLTVEVPALLSLPALGDREVTRVTYHLAEWDPAPRQLMVAGRKVRLSGYRTGEPHAVRLSDTWGRVRLDLVLVAPETEPEIAERILALAAQSGSTRRPGEILTEARSD